MSKKKQEARNEYQENIIYALDAMNNLYGDFPVTELIYHTPFQLLVSVMLSAQTTDKQVNKVTEKFYDTIREPQDICRLSEEEVYELVKGVNYSKTKAKHIYETAKMLSVAGCIPDTLEELTKLPGVGIKTAKVVLAVLYHQPYIAVDTHVYRVSHRLGWVKDLSPEKTSESLENMIPDTYKDLAHRVMIYFGRYLCKSQNPECERCPLQQQCVYFKNKQNDKR